MLYFFSLHSTLRRNMLVKEVPESLCLAVLPNDHFLKNNSTNCTSIQSNFSQFTLLDLLLWVSAVGLMDVSLQALTVLKVPIISNSFKLALK